MKNVLVKYLFLVLLFNPQLFFSQISNRISVGGAFFTLAVGNKIHDYNENQVGRFIIRDYNVSTDESKSGKYKLPVRDLLIAVPQNSHPDISLLSFSSTRINVVPSINPIPVLQNDSTVVAKSVESMNEKVDTPNLLEVLGYVRIRDFYCAHIRLNSHQFDENANQLIQYSDIVIKVNLDNNKPILSNSKIEIRTPFDESLKEIIANSEMAEQFRSSFFIPGYDDSFGRWIDYSAEYLKIGVANDGIYRIGKSDFEKFGINTGSINPKTLQLFESGIERPIYVTGEGDLSFDAANQIEFIGSKNYSKLSPRIINKNDEVYTELLNRYTDTTYYFLTWNKRDGIRAQINNSNAILATDTLDYYDEFFHLEDNPIDALFYTFSESLVRNQFPFWETSKAWYWRWLATWSSSISQSFQVSNLVTNKLASFYAKIASFGSNQSSKPHYVTFNLNSQKMDSVYLDRFGRKLLIGKSSSLLKNGNNTFNLTYKENNGSTSGICLLDWLEVEYPRKLELQNDSLTFGFRNELPIKARVIKIGKATNAEYTVYRTKPLLRKIQNYQILGGYLLIKDSVGTGYEYSVTSIRKLLQPVKSIKKTFANIRNQLKPSDYIAISRQNFKNSVNKYISNISSIMSLKTSTFYVDDIYDEFGFGYPTPESIKEFIKYVLMNSPRPLPSFLTLIGDANYDYKGIRKKQSGVRIGENYVPSYGFPVSDSWYVIYDSLSISLPQMFVGRIPINAESELDFYSSKMQKNYTDTFDDWNKRFLFFSGGSGAQSELDNLRSVQQQVIDRYIKPAPLAGLSDHFYKIKGNDFGPYSQDYVNNAIEQSAIFISYLGHSGTSTWDNSISDVTQLKSSKNRNYFVADFGCSTNKFAEPDITCFGERFILSKDGQALGYLGNSSLGFTSVANAAPNLLFESIVKDKMSSIGQIHWLTKSKMFSQLGNSETSRLFNYSNTLLGDPAINLRIPDKPNLVISNDNVILGSNRIFLDSQDSVSVVIRYNNFGIAQNRKHTVRVTHFFNQKIIVQLEKSVSLPNNQDSISVNFYVKNLPGLHSIKIELDAKNEIEEIYEDDNSLTTSFFVTANQVRDQFISQTSNGKVTFLNVLSPHQKPLVIPKLIFRSSTNSSFSNYNQKEITLNNFYTKIILNENDSFRHWIKYGLLLQDTVWTDVKSYSNKANNKISINDAFSFPTLKYKKLSYDVNGIGFTKDTVNVSVISAGQFAGGTCIISLNGKNLLDNTFFSGIGICVFNPFTMEIEDSKWFHLFNNSANHTAFENFVKSIPNGKIVALGISVDAVNNNSTQFRNVLKSLGSTKADSILFKGSWAFIGIKGSDSHSFVEVVRDPYGGLITINKNFIVNQNNGAIETEMFGPVNKWGAITLSTNGNSGLDFNLIPIGFTHLSLPGDTLSIAQFNNNKVELDKIISQRYPYSKFIIQMKDNSNSGSGYLKSIGFDYLGVPELGTNYQVVSIAKDSLDQGEKANLNFSVYNVGESTASNFKVRVDLVKKDNSKEQLFEQLVDSIQTEKKKDFSLTYTTDKITGSNQFQITIDTDNLVTELYKDNNFYAVPFYVKPNNKPASLKLTIDGSDIVNGDFVSSKPIFKIELSDESLISITDTTKILLYLNNKRLYFATNTNVLTYNYSATNPKMIVNYTPTLADGDYTFKVVGKNATDQIIDSTGIVRKFTVKNELQLLNAYNYPNPFKDDTHFTFKLTQIPDELRIIIYTIAGRKIKEIRLSAAELKYDFNRIFWNGRDQDGDLAANGVYLYKIISQKGSEKTELTEKLAIIR